MWRQKPVILWTIHDKRPEVSGAMCYPHCSNFYFHKIQICGGLDNTFAAQARLQATSPCISVEVCIQWFQEALWPSSISSGPVKTA